MGLGHSPKIVTSGLVLYLDAANPKSYPGSGTNIVDVSKNNNTISLTNGTSFNNNLNGFFSFDGVNDYINTNYLIISGTDSSKAITIDLFIRPDAAQPTATFNPVIIGSGYYSGFGLRYTGSIYQNWIRLATGVFVRDINVSMGNFNHIVLIWGGESDSKLSTFLNGVKLNDLNVTYGAFGQNHNSWPFRIGFPYTTGGNTATGYFKGDIGTVKVYDRALTDLEVQQNFNATRGRYGI